MTERVVITGAAGAIGVLLRHELAGKDRELVLVDIAPQEPVAPGEAARVVTASVEDLGALRQAVAGADAIIHLAGLIDGHAWEEYVRVNITGTYNVLEAARRAGVGRVVYASSNHAVGWTERSSQVVPADLFPRPDSYYGVGKVAAEALCSLYHDRHGIDAICVRIGSCRPVPDDARCLWSWLSYPDTVRLMRAALSVESPGFRVVWGVSNNTRGWWSLEEGRAIGYDPRDDAECHLQQILSVDPEPAAGENLDRLEYLGGGYTVPGFDAAGRTGPEPF